MFNENSALVKVWVSLIKNGQYAAKDIPDIQNLREVVLRLLEN